MPSTKTDFLIDLLGKRIVNGDYAPGTSLPSEMKLSEEFNLSRNVIREALRSLVSKNLIENIPYKGAFVSPTVKWNYLDPDILRWELTQKVNSPILLSLNEMRLKIEPIVARWAAEKATSQDLVYIESAFNKMSLNKNNITNFNNARIQFHRAILNSTHNLVLRQLDTALCSLLFITFHNDQNFSEDDILIRLKKCEKLFNAIRYQNIEDAEMMAIDILSHPEAE
ncbi:FadR/GntR family transcriptional regulator [Klebsiella aerogenes]|uniref:FadR/GntR family transcriptional regulator n=1 Tax=Klebsiella aerogenes TaxID=548 RepID=UPI0021D22317|nr:FadR/GntR family transcriptional regulator [Klebsiella aerogenes]MCU6317012.1 FadR family transcriptional regulator [Klebsiella aerogenes]